VNAASPETRHEEGRRPPARWQAYQRLLWPALTLLLLLIPGWPLLEQYGGEARELSQRLAFWALGSAIGLTLAWLCVRLIDVVVWGFLEARFQTQVPRLLKDVVVVLVFAAAIITIVGLVFQRDVTGLWVSSGILGVIVGLAIRGTIADVFSGIALNIDRPFRPGDWIEVHPRGVKAVRGRVLEVNWRATRLQTIDHTVVVLPNNLVAINLLVNLSLPEPRSRFALTFCLEFGIPPERALRILGAGVRAAKGPLADPPPKVTIDRVTEVGVEYKVRYWLDPVQVSPRKGRHEVTLSILQHLFHAGLSLAYPKQDLFLSRMPVRQLNRDRDRRELLSRVELLATLRPEELDRLAAAAIERTLPAGVAVVRQDDPGNSMFVVVEGLLEVYRRCAADPGSESMRVVELQPGEFFGEMSLLTGASRSATVLASTESVVYEIGASEINAVLASRPELAWHLAEVVARRQEQLEEVRNNPDAAAPEAARPRVVQQILEGMRGFLSSLRDCFHGHGRVDDDDDDEAGDGPHGDRQG
jgi:small-conductance mechanosensitive channel/CRP-like cAMP-binding protein